VERAVFDQRWETVWDAAPAHRGARSRLAAGCVQRREAGGVHGNPGLVQPRQILEGNVLTRWLADGSGLVYQNQKNLIFFYDLANGRSRPIATQPDVVSMHTPSLDAKWIVYQSTSTDAGNVDVHAVGLDGGQPRVVASTRRQDFHPFFSPSGRWVYFQPDHKNLNRVPGPGQDWKRADPVKVTDFPESGLFLEDPQISRDGKQLLYARGKITGDI
jgi:Tol biopolymer transport system component